MKYCKIVNNKVIQTQRSPESGFIECPEYVTCGMVKIDEDYQQPAPHVKTPEEIDAEKDAIAEAAVSSPALEAAIETFVSILTAANIPCPTDVQANIKERIKGKL
jgi:hypothetical protein